MENVGRESAKDNDLFFTCSLIDHISRKTKNTRTEVVNALGEKNLAKIYDLADILSEKQKLKWGILIMCQHVNTLFHRIGILVKCIKD